MPRPLLEMQHARDVNQMLHFDYMYVRKPSATSSHSFAYVLVLVDDYSKFTELIPCTNADTDHVVRALLGWLQRYGVVPTWVSDQGSHFLNTVVEELRRILRVDHHFTVPYAPWSNGVVERRNREVRETLLTLLSDARLPEDEWPYILPVVNAVLNQTPSSTIAGYCPIEIFIGRPPTSPISVVFRPDQEFSELPIDTSSFQESVERLRQLLSDRHRRVDSQPRRRRAPQPGERDIDFSVGDFVLVARQGPAARDKMATPWEGPFQVVDVVNDRTFTIQDLITGDRRDVHARFICSGSLCASVRGGQAKQLLGVVL